MSVVVLGKSWNAGKVMEVVSELLSCGVTVRAVVAMKRPPAIRTWREIVQKLFYSEKDRLFQTLRLRSPQPRSARPSEAGGLDFVSAAERISPGQKGVPLPEFSRERSIEYIEVEDLNGTEAEAILRRLAPQLLVLAGTPILRPNILAVPVKGTLNVHMGILPQFRGRNVAEWAVFLDAPVGLTVHYVDPGVDTGAIVRVETVDVSDCPDIDSMRRKLRTLQHRLLAQCTREVLDGKITAVPQPPGKGKQYYVMHERLKRVVNHKLEAGYRPRNVGSRSRGSMNTTRRIARPPKLLSEKT